MSHPPAINCAHDALVPVADLKGNPDNPNKHDAAQLALYAKILLHQGWRKSLTVSNQSGFIVTGHGAWMTAKAQGWPNVPVDYQDFASKADEVAHMIADNKLAQMAELDDVELARLIRAELDGKCDLDLTGLDLEGLREIGAAPPEPIVDAPPQIDRAEELRIKWCVERGQLWELGEHRLLCGDSTKAEDVARIMNGEKAVLIFTDPPYGVSVNETNWIPTQKRGPSFSHKLANDELRGSELRAFICEAFNTVLRFCIPSPGVYCWAAPLAAGYEMLLGLLDAGIHIQGQLVWVKPSLTLGQADYQWRHEVCWYGYVKADGKPHAWFGGRDKTTVWEAARESDSSHPTMKPTALAALAITHNSATRDSVLEPFSGSGSTLMACEQLGRRCRAIEIDAGYVAVTVQRWADATGKTPKREDSGQGIGRVK